MATFDEIRALENELMSIRLRLAELRQSEPEPVRDFELDEWNGPVRLSDLFGDRSDLLVIHNMGAECAYCTLWADGLNGLAPHLEDRAALVMVSPDQIDAQMKFAESRGWRFRMLSDGSREFSKAMGFWDAQNASALPGVSAFAKLPNGEVVRTGHADFGPGDEFCAAWPMMSLLKEGVHDWSPKHVYADDSAAVLI